MDLILSPGVLEGTSVSFDEYFVLGVAPVPPPCLHIGVARFLDSGVFFFTRFLNAQVS